MYIAVYTNKKKSACKPAFKAVVAYLKSKNIRYYLPDLKKTDAALKHTANLVLSIGGDGSILHAARAAIKTGVPVLGINSGNLGFLSAIDGFDGFGEKFEALLKNKTARQKRTAFAVKVSRDGKTIFNDIAINECVIKSGEARAVSVSASYGKHKLRPYFGDGLIISTSTGSTAYNLAAGGPIALPSLDVFILTAICPHTLAQRPLILPASKEISILIPARANGRVMLSADGQINLDLKERDLITVKKYPKRFTVITPRASSFFDILSSKLNWGGRRESLRE
jgi:NAD+ kinase